MTLSFRVLGVPVPQGSKSASVVNGRAVMREQKGKVLHNWREAVANAAKEAMAGFPPYDGALQLNVVFVMPRPKSARKGAVWHTAKPDSDKLLRALGDSLTMAGVIRDDARLARISVSKVLADPAEPWTGADIEIHQLANGERNTMMPLYAARKQTDVNTGGRL